MTTVSPPHVGAPVAYLRCYPRDPWEMAAHRNALTAYAQGIGLSRPVVCLDNGVSSREERPALEQLLAHVLAGAVRIVLIPGLWVFSLDPERARAIADRFITAGAQIIDLPGRWHEHEGRRVARW
ncbi:hypothetical protein ACWGR4_20710 [Embleya sp. NPDC055664]|uniref:hypothetical protein n=1 Tax=unclassified Embleya TaxID=2699296 RepID=UPI0036C7E977